MRFGKVKIGEDDDNNKKKRNRKVSKVKELERVKRENRKVAVRELWKATAKRAMGVKVYDNPSKLKQSMKKEKRRNEKSREKCKERVDNREKLKEERQPKRRNNIAAKVKVKKMRKIAKRDKKLIRPG
ncbi:PREDICTED: golgin subfamily A member 6-like protein 22 [Nicotiana attenuata]|uniref:golgin subfamily A member 6-like protein 22 n=1 Tax=Nicotiana attenuata TaxID=49451 RepID=UPI000904D309|nr:PREDICTED: golgin subfamily A member 6-like protein 22 [Nicotiana attenuata]